MTEILPPEGAHGGVEAFLIEDVILTLGNIRATLDWLGAEPAQRQAGLDRLDRQIELLEMRARRMCRSLGQAAAPIGGLECTGKAEPDRALTDDNLFAGPEDAEDLAGGQRYRPVGMIFRSRRMA